MTRPFERIPRRGKTIRELSEATGISARTIIAWTSEPREVYLARANAKRKKAHELRARGLSMRAIAAEIGCGVASVHRYLSEEASSRG